MPSARILHAAPHPQARTFLHDLPGWLCRGAGAAPEYWRFPCYEAWERALRGGGEDSPRRLKYASGHSLGALTLLRACASGALKIDSAVLIAPPFRPGGPQARDFAERFRADPRAALARFAGMIAMGHEGEEAGRIRRYYRDSFAELSPRALRYARRWLEHELHGFDAARLNVPPSRLPRRLTLVFGARDAITPLGDAERWQALIPSAAVVIVGDSGHLPAPPLRSKAQEEGR